MDYDRLKNGEVYWYGNLHPLFTHSLKTSTICIVLFYLVAILIIKKLVLWLSFSSNELIICRPHLYTMFVLNILQEIICMYGFKVYFWHQNVLQLKMAWYEICFDNENKWLTLSTVNSITNFKITSLMLFKTALKQYVISYFSIFFVSKGWRQNSQRGWSYFVLV